MIGRHVYRRRLPHYQSRDRTYFVTFNTLNRLVLPPKARDIVFRHVVDAKSCFLHSAVVMPDHVHILITPDDCALNEITGKIKGGSAHDVNQLLNRTGSLWQHESFDHELRNDESVRQKAEYIIQNPVRRGLVACADDYPWIYRSWKK